MDMASNALRRPGAVCSAVVLLTLCVVCVDALSYSPAWGGPHGRGFNDATGSRRNERVTRITINAGRRVDRVTFYTQYRVLSHGGGGGSARTIRLDANEWVVEYYVCLTKRKGKTRVSYVYFKTSKGKSVSGGRTTGKCHRYRPPRRAWVFGMHGRSGKEVDKLGLVMNNA